METLLKLLPEKDQNNDTVIDQYIFYIQLFLIHSLFLL